MKVIHHPSKVSDKKHPVCCAIGMFDGVHLGHQQVIRQTVSNAKQLNGISIGITFDRHPNATVAPQKMPLLIYPLRKRLDVIGGTALDYAYVIEFNKAFSQKSGEEFIRELAGHFPMLRSLCVGSKFAFGHKRSGDVNLMQRLGRELEFRVHGLAAVSLDGKTVSSTRIRETIRTGELDAASQMLGRPYELVGQVVHGDSLGIKLGFPTANLEITGLVLPPNGVYAVRIKIDGNAYRGALNVGVRPTLRHPQPSLQAEVHLLNFSGDLYDQILELTLISKLRNEKAFSSIDQLKRQIETDVAEVRRLLP